MIRLLAWLTAAVTAITLAIIAAVTVLGGALPSDQIVYDSMRDGSTDLYLLDAGRDLSARLTRGGAMHVGAAWSPDGLRVAYLQMRPGQRENALIVMDWDGANARPLTTVALTSLSSSPIAWSPDGHQIAYTALDSSGSQGVYVINTDGTGAQRLTESRGNVFAPTWSSTGRMAFAWSPVANSEIYVFDPQLVMTLDSHTTTPRPVRITDNYYTDTAPSWSPDGSWIAFVSDRGGSSDVYLMRPDGSELHPITNDTDLDTAPSWSPDGQHIIYIASHAGQRTLMIVDRDGGPPRPLWSDGGETSRPAWRPVRTHS